jgi:hypothetical protein
VTLKSGRGRIAQLDIPFWNIKLRGHKETATDFYRAGGCHAFRMLSSEQAVLVNIEIMRAFVRLRRMF